MPKKSKTKKSKTKKAGTVRKVLKSMHPSITEKAEIEIHDADDLYKEIRIENRLVDPQGKTVKLKPGSEVDVTIEADQKDTVSDTDDK